MTLPKSSLDSHVSVLAQCVVKLPPRNGISFVGSRLPNSVGEYEIVFRHEPTDEVDSISVPVEMVYATIASSDWSQLLGHISAHYVLLFRKSSAGDRYAHNAVPQPEALSD